LELNKEGFVIKGRSGIEAYSHHSAWSGVVVGNGGITVSVPGVPELFFRLAAGEGRLTDEQRAGIEQRAKAWYASRQPAPKRRAVAAEPISDEKED